MKKQTQPPITPPWVTGGDDLRAIGVQRMASRIIVMCLIPRSQSEQE